jgi:hypothetical protein
VIKLTLALHTPTRLVLAVALLAILPEQATGQAPAGAVTVTRDSGGSIKTPLSIGIAVNDKSSMQREFIAIHDASLPVDLVGTPGVRTVYASEGRTGSYKYNASVNIKPTEALTAIEYRFILFDIWGNHVKSLSATEVEDLPAAQTKGFTPAWNVYSENEVSQHYASIAYVARVRTAAGKVVEADPSAALTEARRFSKKFTAADLDPTKEKK